MRERLDVVNNNIIEMRVVKAFVCLFSHTSRKGHLGLKSSFICFRIAIALI